MHYKEKKKVRELLQVSIDGLIGKGATRLSEKPLGQIEGSLSLVKEILEKEAIRPDRTLDQLSKLQELARQDYATKKCDDLCDTLMQSFDAEVESRFKVVFFPYKASMWDSLESIYFAARDDDSCDVEVVPIPYYKLSKDNAESTYEGDLFPEDIPITYYSAYDLEKERPDVIYVHNIYDQHNTLTRVFEEYYTINLKKYTDVLVYVPYCLFSFIPGSTTEYIAYKLPGIKNVDKVILQADYLRKAALDFGVPPNKLLVLGSPKVDKVVNSMSQSLVYAEEWREKIENKTVFLLDTHLLYFANQQPFKQLETLIKILNIPNYIEDSVLIWRPHPLFMSGIKNYNPYFTDFFEDLIQNRIGRGEYSNVIFDENPNYLTTILAADVYIGGLFSLMHSVLFTDKQIILLESELPAGSLLPSNLFEFLFDIEGIKVASLRGVLQDKQITTKHRRSALKNVYANIDGSSGETIYMTIKNQLCL
ncbi:MAG: hypothetical protein GX963_02675 [Bacteroidales bacterium]|nr:hypothetical protein [Bacteroidales bacterium]